MSIKTWRRLSAFLLGALTGLVYSLVAELVNVFLLPNLPLYQPAPGLALNILLTVLGGGVLGLLSAWRDSAVEGVFLGCLLGGSVLELIALVNAWSQPEQFGGVFVLVVSTFCPMVALLVPIAVALRVVVNRFEDERMALELPLGPSSPARPMVWLAGLIVVAGLIGSFSIYSSEARQVLTRMDELLQMGLGAASTASLPPAFRSGEVDNFVQNAQGGYTLEWDNSNLDRFPIRRPTGDPWKQSVVIARFENGWVLFCLFSRADAAPTCGSY